MSPLPAGPVALDTPLELPDTADTEALGERLATDLRAGDLLVLSDRWAPARLRWCAAWPGASASPGRSPRPPSA